MTDIFELLKGKQNSKGDFQKQPVVVQGITGKYGTRHTKLMIEYGTNIVAGVTPGKGGQKFENSVPIYETIKEAVDKTGAKISIMFVPAKFFLGAAKDALEAGIKLLVAIPEHVPVHDTMKIVELAKQKDAIVIGPNTPGVMIPELIKIGIMPASPFKFGNIVVLSKSGTLLYEICNNLSNSGFGQCITIGVGGDPINGTRLTDAFDMVKDYPDLEGIVVVGEIGGDAEEVLAQKIIDENFNKPVVAYIAGRSAPKEKRMGHAGAIVSSEAESAPEKVEALKSAGAFISESPANLGINMLNVLKQKI